MSSLSGGAVQRPLHVLDRNQTNWNGALLLITKILQIRKWCGIAMTSWRWGNAKRCQRFRQYDPGRYRCAKVLGQKGAERLIFPSLNIAGRPVIHQTEPSEMSPGLTYWYRLAKFIALSNPNP